MTNLAFYRPLKLDSRKAAESICGPLSWPSKMPCASYNLPAKRCKTGSALHAVPGSVCEKCYARKGRYVFSNVQRAMERHIDSINHPQWADAVAYLIKDHQQTYFRWHDSGDIQSLAHLLNIVRVAELCPKTKFWLPTKEKGLVKEYLRSFGEFPKNMCVRLSAAMIDGAAPDFPNTNTVHRDTPRPKHACPAHEQGNHCGDCRACWDRKVKNVALRYH